MTPNTSSEQPDYLSRAYDVYQSVISALGKEADVERVRTIARLYTNRPIDIEYVCLDPDTSGEIRLLRDRVLISIDKDLSPSDALHTFCHEVGHVFFEDLMEMDADFATFNANRSAYPPLKRDDNESDIAREKANEAFGTMLFLYILNSSMLPPESARMLHGED